jgi:hypothetical protein
MAGTNEAFSRVKIDPQPVFASMTTVAMLLRRLGIDHLGVNAAKYVPGGAPSARPDRAGTMKSVVLSKDGAKARCGKK